MDKQFVETLLYSMVIQDSVGLREGPYVQIQDETFDAHIVHLISLGVITSNSVKPLGDATLEKSHCSLTPQNAS